jgi:DNA-binding GntR family transcriptional regulator
MPREAMMGSTTLTAKQREVQRIVDALSIAIAQHRLRPGNRLIEAQIVEALNANRNHVQVALQRLAIQRLVSIEANRGAMVAAPTATEAREVFAARRAIERAVVESITPAQLTEQAARIAQQMAAEQQAIASGDRRAIVRELSGFHGMLGQLAGNSVMADILDNLTVRSALIVALYQRNDVPTCMSHDHQQILDALALGDKDRAVAMLLAHLDALEGQLAFEEQAVVEVDLREALVGL